MTQPARKSSHQQLSRNAIGYRERSILSGAKDDGTSPWAEAVQLLGRCGASADHVLASRFAAAVQSDQSETLTQLLDTKDRLDTLQKVDLIATSYGRAPQIDAQRYPLEEWPYITYYQRRLDSIVRFVEDFAATMLLCVDLNMPRQLWTRSSSRWRFVSCRDGALTLYHLSKALHEAKPDARAVPNFTADIPTLPLKAARRRFREAFPDVEDLRHAIAHQSELTNTQQKADDLWIHHPYGTKLLITDTIVDGYFTTTFEGRLVKYLPEPTTAVLTKSIADEFLATFQDVALPHR